VVGVESLRAPPGAPKACCQDVEIVLSLIANRRNHLNANLSVAGETGPLAAALFCLGFGGCLGLDASALGV